MTLGPSTKGPRDKAHEKEFGHSTIVSAEKVGMELGAKINVVTHISFRYTNIKVETSKGVDNVVFAYDFISIKPEIIEKLLEKSCVLLPIS